MLTCGASGAPLFSLSVRVTAGYRGEGRGDNKRENAHRQKEKALLEKTPTALFILRFVACGQTFRAETSLFGSFQSVPFLFRRCAPRRVPMQVRCAGFSSAGLRRQSGLQYNGRYPAHDLVRHAAVATSGNPSRSSRRAAPWASTMASSSHARLLIRQALPAGRHQCVCNAISRDGAWE